MCWLLDSEVKSEWAVVRSGSNKRTFKKSHFLKFLKNEVSFIVVVVLAEKIKQWGWLIFITLLRLARLLFHDSSHHGGTFFAKKKKQKKIRFSEFVQFLPHISFISTKQHVSLYKITSLFLISSLLSFGPYPKLQNCKIAKLHVHFARCAQLRTFYPPYDPPSEQTSQIPTLQVIPQIKVII